MVQTLARMFGLGRGQSFARPLLTALTALIGLAGALAVEPPEAHAQAACAAINTNVFLTGLNETRTSNETYQLNAGDMVMFSATGTISPGTNVQVRLISAPGGVTTPATLLSTNSLPATANFTAPAAGNYVFQFLVNFDNNLAIVSQEVTFTANCVDGPGTSINGTVSNIQDRTVETVESFMQRRNDLLLVSAPDRARYIRRDPQALWGGGTDEPVLDIKAYQGQQSMNAYASLSGIIRQTEERKRKERWRADGEKPYASAPAPYMGRRTGLDLWIEAHGQRYHDDGGSADRTGHFGVVFLGGDFFINPSILVGVLVQSDWIRDEGNTLNTEVEGHGWMAGPYISVRLHQNLFFDARAAWGESDNDITPTGTYTDSYTSERWLVHANLTGNWENGRWRFTPEASISYIEAESETYTDFNGIQISGQTVSTGILTLGPEIGYLYVMDNGTVIEPHAKLEGIWHFDQDENVTVGGITSSNSDLRARIQAGLQIKTVDEWAFRGVIVYDGIGVDDFESYGFRASLNIPLWMPL